MRSGGFLAVAPSSALLVGLLLLLLARPASASDRVAVLIVGAEDRFEELADQSTEVLVAAVSRRADVEVIGKEEFLARLQLASRQDVERCLQERTCLARADSVLGLATTVVGYLGGEQQTLRLHLLLVSVDGRIGRQVKREFDGGPRALLAGCSSMLDELFQADQAPLRVEASPPGAAVYLDDQPVGTTPLLLPGVTLGAHLLRLEAAGRVTQRQRVELGPGGAQLRIELPLDASQGGTSLTEGVPRQQTGGGRLLPWSLAGGAAAAGIVGGVLHLLAWQDSEDYATARAPAELDTLRERGERRWTAARLCYAGGAVLAVGAAAVWSLGRSAPGTTAGSPPTGSVAPPTTSFSLLPLPGGAALSGRVDF